MGRASRAKQERRTRPPGELKERLISQLRLLRASAIGFDAGSMDEACRMALTVRILCHSGNGPCLLQQVGLLKSAWFYDTASALHGLTPTGSPFVGAFPSALVIIKAAPSALQEVARLDVGSPSNVTWSRFKPWWNKPVLSANLSKALVGGPVEESTRRDVILWLANQDGGAHVDAMIDADYDSVRNSVFGTVQASDGTRSVVKMPIAASMRQIAHEVLVTMQDHSGVDPPLPVGNPSTKRPVPPK